MLIAPLDWGLGHATRCIPLIEKLLIAGFKVIIAAEGDQKILLQKTFPDLELLHLQGYRLRYGSTKWATISKIIFQIPQILIAINREKNWLNQLVTEKHLDAVIADNRYGLQHKKIFSVFITHQLHIKTSFGKYTDALLQKINYRFINRFTQCWVPDAADGNNLAGELSHPSNMPVVPVLYTGILSSIHKQQIPVSNGLLLLLSGPEPQRSIFEALLLTQLAHYPHPAILVRGLPAATEILQGPAFLTIYNFCAGAQLQALINQSDIIISRSGYSTIMDVLPLGKKCIFIPTPGQAEQEYLAAYLAEKNYACIGSQQNFSLAELVAQTAQLQPPNPDDKLSGSIDKAIMDLKASLDTQQTT